MVKRVKDGRLTFGINELDEQALRGIPKGSTIALLANPRLAGNKLLLQLATTGRKTHYATINRPESSVKREAKVVNRGEPFENLEIYPEYRNNNKTKSNLDRFIDRVGEEENFVVDNFSSVGESLSSIDYLKIVRNIVKHTQRKNSITVLLLLTDSENDLEKHEKDMLNTVDGVFRLTPRVTGGTQENLLYIEKLRGADEIPDRGIEVFLEERVTVSSARTVGS